MAGPPSPNDEPPPAIVVVTPPLTFPDHKIVANIKVAGAIEGNGLREAEAADNRRNNAVGHLSNRAVVTVGDVQVSG